MNRTEDEDATIVSAMSKDVNSAETAPAPAPMGSELWTKIQGVCAEDTQLFAKVEEHLNWEGAELCGTAFRDLKELDFRRKQGRTVKRLLELEPCLSHTIVLDDDAGGEGEGEGDGGGGGGSGSGGAMSAVADDSPLPRNSSVRAKKRRKRIKTIGQMLYNISRNRFICTDPVAKRAAQRIAQFCFARLFRATRREQGICYFVPWKATNQQDCVTLCDIDTIPRPFFLSMPTMNEKGKIHHYAFDVRSLWYMLGEGAANPFTNKPFLETERKRVEMRVQRLERMGYSCALAEPAATASVNIGQQQQLRIVSLCQQLDKLVALTNVEWIRALSAPLLGEWWRHVEDIINWRSELPPAVRAKVVPNNVIFNQASKLALHVLGNNRDNVFDFVMRQMECLLRDSADDEHRALGAMYILTGLCCSSEGARTTLPWLYQPPNE